MSKSSFKQLIESEKPVVIDFYADWCGPCKAVTPILDQLKKDLGDRVRILKIDVDKNQALSNKLGISSIPTIMLYQNGDMKWRAAGVQSLSTLKNHLNPLLT